MEIGREHADDEHSRRTHEHNGILGEIGPEQGAEDSSHQRGAGINVLDEDVGHLTGKDIPDYAAANTGNHAHKNQQEATAVP